MNLVTRPTKDLFLVFEHCNKLSRSPIKPERKKSFWENDGITYIYDSDGQLFAIREANYLISKGSRIVTIKGILLNNDFTQKSFSNEVVLNPSVITCT